MNHCPPAVRPLVATLCLLAALLAPPARAQCLRTVPVSSTSALNSALSGALPGDCIVLANGNYSGVNVTHSGTASSPITISAANQGQAVFTSGIFQMNNASWITVQGIGFTTTGGSFSADSTTVAVLMGLNGATNCRITRCTFDPPTNTLPANTFFTYLSGTCLSNRVDHCEYGWYTNSGCHSVRTSGNVTIAGVSPPSDRTPWAFGYGPFNPNMARYTRIDHNYFHDHHTPAASGGETIQLGAIGDTGDYQSDLSLVEYNLFVNCDGDPEIISVKSSSNVIRYNTVRTSSAVFSLRAGNGDTVYGNYFLCAGSGGGIKSSEHDHRIFNNYVENSDTSNYPFMFESGNLYNSGFSHAQAVRVQLAHNTVVNPGRQVLFEHSGVLPAVDSSCVNNIITGSGTLYSEDVTSLNMTRSQNIIFGYTPSQSGFIVENPLLTGSSPSRLSSSSPAIRAANTNYYSYVTEDMDGQPRAVPRDVGADEYDTTDFTARAPLNVGDVGTGAVDLELSAAPQSLAVNTGATNVSSLIDMTADSGFTNPITFTVTGMPQGMTAGFSPVSVDGSGSTVLGVTNSAFVPAGVYPLLVNATGSNFTSTLTVTLQVGRNPCNLRWTSTGSGSWDVQNSSNWFNITSNATDAFYNGDTFLLDDTAGVQTSLGIAASTTVSPSVVSNTSSANNFTISGSGQISGATQLIKTGSSTLLLNTSNLFSGGIVVSGGTLKAGNPNSLGGQGGFVIVTNGATLDVNGNNLGMDTILASGAGVDGNGAIINSGAAAFPALALVEMAGDTTIGGTGRWDLRSSGGTTGNPGTASLSTSGNGYSLTKVGTNFVGICSATVDPGLANINVMGGTLDIEGNTTGLGATGGTVTVYTNATLYLFSATNLLNKKFTLNNGATIQNASGANVIVGPVALSGNDTFNITGTSLTFSNTLSGSGSLIETGGSTLDLAAADNCTGNTVVSNGTLAVLGSGTLLNSPQITIGSGATLSVSGKVVANSGGIVSGGSGSALVVNGGTLIATNGLVGAATAPLGSITLTGANLQLAVTGSGTNLTTGTLVPSGSASTINVTSLPVVVSTSQFQLIKYTTLSGGFNFVLGPLPGGYSGYLSNNTANASVDLVVVNGLTFGIAASPSSRTVLAGASTNYTVTVTTNNTGFTGNVTFGVAGLPANTTASFNPTSLPGNGSSTLTVSTAANTPSGGFVLTIYGTNSAGTPTATTALTVNGLGGNPGSMLWTAASGADTNWSSSLNWTNLTGFGYGPPGISNDVIFSNAAAQSVIGTIDSVVESSRTVDSLWFANTNGYHSVLIAPGQTLTVLGGVPGTSGTPVLLAGNEQTNTAQSPLAPYSTITGPGGTLVLSNPAVRMIVRQGGASSSGVLVTNLSTLDLSGLGTFNATVDGISLGVESSVPRLVAGTLYLAETNDLTLDQSLTGITAWWTSGNPALVLGHDTKSGETAGSTMYLGISNAIYVNYVVIGRGTQSNAPCLLAFNPAFASNSPSAFFRAADSVSAIGIWAIGDNSSGDSGWGPSPATVDFTGGAVDVLITNLFVGRGHDGNASGSTGVGTLTFDTGTVNGGVIKVGAQVDDVVGASTNSSGVGAVNVNGAAATLIATSSLELGHLNGGSIASANSATTGTLNVNGGNIQANAIIAGGGSSTIIITGGTLTVTNTAGTPGSPLTVFDPDDATLQVQVNGSSVVTNISATSVTAGGANVINLFAVSHVTTATTFPLLSYGSLSGSVSGNFSLGAIPAGYRAILVDNSAQKRIDLKIASAPATPPEINSAAPLASAGLAVSGNNGPPGWTYYVLGSTNIAQPLSTWARISTNAFDSGGNFSFTNAVNSSVPAQFYTLELQ
jgi:poly(beta-D-mannuronate) lyase